MSEARETWYPGKLFGFKKETTIFKERRLFNVLASSPAEIRGLRRFVTSGVVTALLLGAYLSSAIEKVPPPRENKTS